MKTILILALDGVMDSSLAITLDTLKAGQAFLARAGQRDAIRIVTAGYRKTVKTGAGLRLDPELSFKQVLEKGIKPEWIIVPGLGLVSDADITARFAQRDALAAIELLRMAEKNLIKTAASCSAVFMLAHAGVLAGREATTTWWLAPAFRSRHPDIRLDETRMLVRDGKYLTAGSAYSQLDLVLAIVADVMGTTIAHLCSRFLLIDQRPSQARYMIHTHLQQVDPTVLAAERWIDGHLSEAISIAELSSTLAVSAKTLARRIEAATGVSPVKFIQRRRLMRAAHLIATTTLSIDAVAAQVGYQDGTALRKLVKREFGITPGALR
ncbi:GlxA family transcriptional regulator [Noviherbaspirillum saxi]|uniref:Helix-turn-helix domain-containing protein n=1 Tax=Noviherbaspirillum saxi TaxID=2320863 RepID=A0A3A3FP33_9BURK|nr:helix-turn-helix domain-containing protein [Noviherbaspirillum saxi]RJF95212.1 helix-turn-helix domain-containing protein [Noviherbaspirillum saxi]